MKDIGTRVLILNADFSPIGLIHWEKAITLDFKGLIRVVDYYKNDSIISAAGHEWPLPAVVSLIRYRKPKKGDIPFSRKNVFLRDNLTCQYCNQKFLAKELTYDHVIPRAKWTHNSTPTCWNNIVSCCYPCNSKKADKTIKEAKMKLLKPPAMPNNSSGFILGLAPWTKLKEEWIPYLPKHYIDIIKQQQPQTGV